MYGFEANNCRLCPKAFCCEKCRKKHEKNVHKINPDCDICVYGKFYFKNLDDNFMRHLESSHLPLYCVYCKKVFSSIEDVLQSKRCDNYFQNLEISPKSPFKISAPPILVSTDDHDSPILLDLQRQQQLNYILATSTPMQRGEEPNLMFEKSKEPITPVDKPSQQVANKSIIKKTDSTKSDEQLSKRRVTFGDTPANTFEKNKILEENMPRDQDILSSKEPESSDMQNFSKKLNDNSTPDTQTTSGQFYSAKIETSPFYSAKTDVSSKPVRSNSNIKNSVEGFTPVGISNRSKLTGNQKGDIYKKQYQDINDSSQTQHFIAVYNDQSLVNLDEVSMELCTPAKQQNPMENSQDSTNKVSVNNDTSPIRDNKEHSQGDGTTNNSSNLFTPAKTSNHGKIAVKGNIYEESGHESMSLVPDGTKPSEKIDDKNDSQNKSESDLETKVISKAEANGHDTLWLSAINLEETNDSEERNDKNKESTEKNKPPQEENISLDTPASPQRNNPRRVSIVMPTPILKTTNVQMKFHFPAHLSSTPIMPSCAIKLKQTEMIKDISTRFIQQQTPYKTPQGKLCELVQRKLVDANIRRALAPLPDVEASSSAAGPPTAGKDIVQLENIKENCRSPDISVQRNVVLESNYDQCEDNYPSLSSHEPETGISVCSMTESNLWSSVTKIVKSVLGGLTNIGQNSSKIAVMNDSNSSKRQLSDSDTYDFLEAPRLKRFKFTDIKCRKSIRDISDLELPRNLPAPAPPLASIEIVRSVSTLYGGQKMIIQCDKATQTDNYLMYGWHPHV